MKISVEVIIIESDTMVRNHLNNFEIDRFQYAPSPRIALDIVQHDKSTLNAAV